MLLCLVTQQTILSHSSTSDTPISPLSRPRRGIPYTPSIYTKRPRRYPTRDPSPSRCFPSLHISTGLLFHSFPSRQIRTPTTTFAFQPLWTPPLIVASTPALSGHAIAGYACCQSFTLSTINNRSTLGHQRSHPFQHVAPTYPPRYPPPLHPSCPRRYPGASLPACGRLFADGNGRARRIFRGARLVVRAKSVRFGFIILVVNTPVLGGRRYGVSADGRWRI